jgi:hypothetical protein
MVLSKVINLGKDNSFQVITPSAVAGVRGTEFSVSYYGDESVVAVKRGKINIEKADKSQTKTIKAGKTAIVKKDMVEKIETRPIRKLEELEIKKISIVEVIPQVKKKSKAFIEKIEKDIIKKEKVIVQEIKQAEKEMKLSLAEIKKKYGRIDQVILYTGKMYKGVILYRGGKYKMLTPSGIIRIPAAKIKHTKFIK